jgi:translation initiation factor 5A
MTTKVVGAGSIRDGSFIVIDGAACKVLSTAISKPGKHGSAKIRIVAMGIIDNRKRDAVYHTGDNVEVPIIEKRTAQVLSITGDSANVMDSETFETFDLKIPEDLKGQIVDGVQVLYWDVLGEKVMKQIKGSGEE